MIEIRQVEQWSRQLKRDFVELPFNLYRHDRCWVPDLRRSTYALLNKDSHPFYSHSDADFFIAYQRDKAVGRMAAIENRRFNQYKRVNAAFFGYFELINDQYVANALFDVGVKWAKMRQLTTMIGPRGLLGLDGKVLVKGFELPPSLGETYNLPYYDTLIQTYGFSIESNYLTGHFPIGTQLSERYRRVAQKILNRGNFSVKSFTSRSEVLSYLPVLLKLQQEAFRGTRTFYPITEDELKDIVDTLKYVADHTLIKLLLKHETPVGLIFALPDISHGLRKANGNLFPLGWLHILRAKRTARQAVVPAIGILPQFQGRGGNAILQKTFVDTINGTAFSDVEVGPIDSENRTSVRDMENQGVQWIKTHRLYQLDIS
ncbi:MAG: hypothetical protein AAF633_10720 [Chloroflexota bacterium]